MMRFFAYFAALALAACAGLAQAQTLDQYGGYTGLKGHNTSGFFRTEKINGRYWLVTPENNVLWSTGICVLQYYDTWGGYCPVTGQYPNPYSNKAKYPGGISEWATAMSARMGRWGFNTNACWGVANITNRTECIRDLSLCSRAPNYGCAMVTSDFPDVWDPKWATTCDTVANSYLSSNKNNPWTIGSFPYNELRWSNPVGFKTVPDAFIAQSSSGYGKQHWVNVFLKGKYAAVADLNAAYGTSFATWDDVLGATSLPDDESYPARLSDKIDFMEDIADKFYSVCTYYMRLYDPNHLVFTTRWAMWYQGYADPYTRPFNERIWKKAGQYCDVFANNGYADFASAEANYQHSSRVFQNAKKPFIVTEHSYLANDSYFKDQPGWLPTQMDRGNSYANHVKELLDIGVADDPNDPGNPAKTCMGQHWFQCYDEPSLGRPDGEAAQFGVLNAQDEAFLPFVEAAETVNAQVYDYAVNGAAFDIPIAPTAVSPANGSSVQTSTPAFNWSYSGDAASYTLLISPVASFPEDQTIRVPGITGTSYTPTAPLAQGTWYWTVKAVNGAGHEGKYLSTVRFDISGLSGSDIDPTACLRCERASGWRNVSNADTAGDGYAFAFLDSSIKTEGQSSLRVAITTNSLNKVSNQKSTATADIPFRYGDCGLDYSGASSLTFDIYPKRFCDTTAAIVPSSKYVRFRLMDLSGNVAADQAVDPNGTLPIGQWSTITVPLSGTRDQISRLEFYVRMSDDKLVWDERVNFNIDNLTVAPIADLTPPAPPAVDPSPYTTDGAVSATLAASDPETGIAEYLYAAGASPGATDLLDWRSNGASSEVHTPCLPLSDGDVCYLSAKAVNGFGLTSEVATSAAIRKVFLVPSPWEARTRPEGSWLAIQGQVVIARFPDMFYVEDPDRCSGIGVIGGSQVSVGDVVTVFGQTQALGHEAIIEGSAADVTSGSALSPVAMTNLATGGAGIGFQESPVDDALSDRFASGLSNLGCLVRTCGKATYIDDWGAFFYLDDGSRLSDGSGHAGVRVASGGPPLPIVNTFCRVGGVMSVTDVAGKCARHIRPRSAADLDYEETAPALVNPGFEAGTLADWTSYGSVDGVQTGTWFGDITAHSGSFFFGNAANWGTKTGGIYQRVAVQPGYRCTARVWSRIYHLDNTANSALSRVGIDPNGGTNPTGGTIKWSAWDQQTQSGYSVWRAIATQVATCSAGGYVTVFLDFKQQNTAGWHINCFDDAVLNVTPP